MLFLWYGEINKGRFMHKLVEIGRERFYDLKNTIKRHQFTGDDEVDFYFNNLEEYAHLYVLSCLMDRGIKAEKAWKIPYQVCKHFNSFDIVSLSKISQEDIIDYFMSKKPHRYNSDMAKVFYNAVQKICNEYCGDVSKIWKDKPSSASVIFQFLQFDGCGIKIATMATNILVREYGVELSDYFSIDISPDIHIRRIMHRLGLVNSENDINSVIFKARELNPDFPGIIDVACWEIGRKYCHPSNPDCLNCLLKQCCKYTCGMDK